MRTISTIPEEIKPSILFNGKVTGTGDAVGILPSGSNSVALQAIVTMGNAASLVLSVVTGDDADGTNPVAITANIPVYLDNVRQTDAKAHTITDDTGSFLVTFCVPSVLIPADKYICLSFADSNDANILSAIALNDVYYGTGLA